MKVVSWVAGTLLALVLLAALAVSMLGERIHRRTWEVAGEVLPPGDAARGRFVAGTLGCTSCHGARLEGGIFLDEPNVARLVAPNLTALRDSYSVADIERVVRHGVKRDGRAAFGMPSAMFHGLSDQEVADVAAFLRGEPRVESELPPTRVRILGRLGLVTRQFVPDAATIDHAAPHRPVPPAEPEALGLHLARTRCSECHGDDLTGSDDVPSLVAMIRAYPAEEFAVLLRSGVGVGGRDLGLMAEMAQRRFRFFNDADIGALYRYLRSR